MFCVCYSGYSSVSRGAPRTPIRAEEHTGLHAPSALDPVFTVVLKLGSSKQVKNLQPIFTITFET